MEVLSDAQYEVLAFVAACNRNYYNPTATQVELWRGNRSPTEAVYKTVHRRVPGVEPSVDLLGLTANERMLSSIVGMQRIFASLGPLAGSGFGAASGYVTDRELVTPAESMIDHLLRLTWLAEIPAPEGGEAGLRLTDLGRALVRDADNEGENNEDVGVVVLGREDPLAYPILVGQLAAAGPGLLVDPYLKLGDLHVIVVSTQLGRILVSGKQNNRREIGAMEAYLGQGSLARRIEVRSSDRLHDRLLIADDGDVVTVGTSLNGVGKTTTVMSPVPFPAAGSIRSEYAHLWAEATLVGPRRGEDDEDLVDGAPGEGASPQGDDAS